MFIFEPGPGIYNVIVQERGKLDLIHLKEYILNSNYKRSKDTGFIQKILNLFELLMLNSQDGCYQINIIGNEITLSIFRNKRWIHFKIS